MQEGKLKPLYMAKSVKELKPMFNIPEGKPARQLCNTAPKLFKQAEDFRLLGDEEKSYIYYMKFLSVVQRIRSSKDYMENNSYYAGSLNKAHLTAALDTAEKLVTSLQQRYKLLQEETSQNFALLEKERKEAEQEQKRREKSETKSDSASIINSYSESSEVSISCTGLYNLLKQPSPKLLLLDARPASDYLESHIRLGSIINVPQDIIKPGASAAALEKSLPVNSKMQWTQRGKVKLVVLLDWSTTTKTLTPGSNLYTLKNILLKWDPEIIYKTGPLILEGGYEEWLLTYPAYTTNAQVIPPSHVKVNPFEFQLRKVKELESIEYPNLETGVGRAEKPGVDRRSKAAAVQAYEKQSQVVRQLLHEKEGVATAVLELERRRLQAEEEWERVRMSKEKEAEEELRQHLQEREEELLTSIQELEMVQRSKEAENQTLRNELEEYKRLEQQAIVSKEDSKQEEEINARIRSKEDEKNKLAFMRQQKLKERERRVAEEKQKEAEKGKPNWNHIDNRKDERVSQTYGERERLAREKVAQERVRHEKVARDKLAHERLEKTLKDSEALAFEKNEHERQARLKLAQLRKDREKLLQDQFELDKQKREKLAREKLSQYHEEHERQSRERLERERQTRETRTGDGQFEEEKPDRELWEYEKRILDKQEKERQTREVKEQEKLAHELKEYDRQAYEQLERERIACEMQEDEQLSRVLQEYERLAHEKKECERLEREKEEEERILLEMKEYERQEEDRLTCMRLEDEKLDRERVARKKSEQERRSRLRKNDDRIAHDGQEQEKGTYYTPLKDIPSGSGTMQRAHSSPNIAQLDDEDGNIRQKVPQFDRTIKPLNRPQPSEIRAARQRNFNPVYGNLGRGLTGLKNLGNTCYMNSILQCLNNTTPLAGYFCGGTYREDINRQTETRGEVAEEVAAVVRALWSGQYRSIAIRDLKTVVGQHRDQFQTTQQQDSNEFLTILMDWLHEDLKKQVGSCPLRELNRDSSESEKQWNQFYKDNSSLIVTLFYGQQKSTVRCLRCNEESVRFETFSNLTLPLPSNCNRCTLEDCVQLYVRGEKITGWKCPACREQREASKKFDILRLPPILIIHFKRFYMDGWCRKRQTFVDFPLSNMDMKKHTILPEQRYTNYNLYGVSNHYGTMEGGHYTAYCKSNAYQKWYKFDDHEVSELSPNDVKSAAAYILFYASIDYDIPDVS